VRPYGFSTLEKQKADALRKPLMILARPERLFAAFGRESLATLGTVAAVRRRPSARFARLVELPIPWFEGRRRTFRVLLINKLDGPPSPNFSPRLAESR
jgi:hypothetical protein